MDADDIIIFKKLVKWLVFGVYDTMISVLVLSA